MGEWDIGTTTWGLEGLQVWDLKGILYGTLREYYMGP